MLAFRVCCLAPRSARVRVVSAIGAIWRCRDASMHLWGLRRLDTPKTWRAIVQVRTWPDLGRQQTTAPGLQTVGRTLPGRADGTGKFGARVGLETLALTKCDGAARPSDAGPVRVQCVTPPRTATRRRLRAHRVGVGGSGIRRGVIPLGVLPIPRPRCIEAVNGPGSQPGPFHINGDDSTSDRVVPASP